MDRYLLKLIERMCNKDKIPPFGSSADTVSFKAHREAEKLKRKAYLPQLKTFVEENSEKDKKSLRDAVYFIMGKLLIKYPEAGYITFLIKRLPVETDKYTISFLLNRLGEIKFPQGIDIEPIIQCTKSDKYPIRHSAIYTLRASDSKSARETAKSFLRSEDIKTNKYEITYANAALYYIGRIEDIPSIEQLTTARIRDVRDSAKSAIEAIRKRGF